MGSAVKLFDTHCHIFETGFTGEDGVRFPTSGKELEVYENLRKEFGIERSLVVGYDESEYAGNSDYIAALSQKRQWLTPLRYAPIGDPLGAHASAYPVTPEKAAELSAQLLRQQEDGSAPKILSLNATPAALTELRASAEALGETWFLISHMGLPGPVTDLQQAREVLQAAVNIGSLPNVSIKLSGQYAATAASHPHTDVQPLVEVLAAGVGLESLVWGSDFSPALDFVSFEAARDCILPTGITAEERHAIYFRNAANMYERFAGVSA